LIDSGLRHTRNGVTIAEYSVHLQLGGLSTGLTEAGRSPRYCDGVSTGRCTSGPPASSSAAGGSAAAGKCEHEKPPGCESAASA
jgi:hypothetical protein